MRAVLALIGVLAVALIVAGVLLTTLKWLIALGVVAMGAAMVLIMVANRHAVR